MRSLIAILVFAVMATLSVSLRQPLRAKPPENVALSAVISMDRLADLVGMHDRAIPSSLVVRAGEKLRLAVTGKHLEGAVVSRDDSGRLMALAAVNGGRLDGPVLLYGGVGRPRLIAWVDAGRPVSYLEFDPNGVVSRFRESPASGSRPRAYGPELTAADLDTLLGID